MTKRILPIFLALLAVCGAFAQPEDNAMRRSIAAYYTKLASLISAKNIAACANMVTGDYVSVDTEGKSRDRAACIAMWKEGMAMMDKVKCTIRLRHVQLQTKEASAWYEMVWEVTMKQNGKTVPMKVTQRFCDTLRMSGSTWKASYCMELMTNEPWNFPTTGGGR